MTFVNCPPFDAFLLQYVREFDCSSFYCTKYITTVLQSYTSPLRSIPQLGVFGILHFLLRSVRECVGGYLELFA